MDTRPPFMNGLLTARGILVALRDRKVVEQREKARRAVDENNHQVSASAAKIDKPPPPLASEPPAEEVAPSKREQLTRRINQIGQELHEVSIQNEAYEAIFHRMAEHYMQNRRIVEDNQRFKRKGFQLEEQIKDFKERIRTNYEKIELNQRQGAEIHTALQQALQEFLRGERERALVEPIRISSITAEELLKGEEVVAEKEKERQKKEGVEEDNSTISLNWRSLAQKTAKKPIVRKVKPSEDMRDSLFTTELYNI